MHTQTLHPCVIVEHDVPKSWAMCCYNNFLSSGRLTCRDLLPFNHKSISEVGQWHWAIKTPGYLKKVNPSIFVTFWNILTIIPLYVVICQVCRSAGSLGPLHVQPCATPHMEESVWKCPVIPICTNHYMSSISMTADVLRRVIQPIFSETYWDLKVINLHGIKPWFDLRSGLFFALIFKCIYILQLTFYIVVFVVSGGLRHWLTFFLQLPVERTTLWIGPVLSSAQ